MSDAENINNMLTTAGKLLDEIGSEISKSDLPYIRPELENIGNALAAILDIQKTIYIHNPQIVPEDLKAKSQHPDWSGEYAKLLLQNESYLSENKPLEAVKLTEAFIQMGPPSSFVGMAGTEIHRIKELFKL